MSYARLCRVAAFGAIVLASVLACDPAQRAAEKAAKSTVTIPPDVGADFQKRVEAYEDFQQKLAATLPKLSKDATPQQIDADQRAIERLVVQARPDAKQGDFFTPDMQAFVRVLFADVFKGAKGLAAMEQVHDEPHPVRPVINKRYPDEVPLSTMPPRVLASLPKLPDQLEYRFVYNHLILMDVHAHIILDFIADAMPAIPARPPKQ